MAAATRHTLLIAGLAVTALPLPAIADCVVRR